MITLVLSTDMNWLLPSEVLDTSSLHPYYLWSNRNMVSIALRSVFEQEVLTFTPVASGPTSMPGYGPPPGITFDRFVRACVVVKTLTEAFQA